MDRLVNTTATARMRLLAALVLAGRRGVHVVTNVNAPDDSRAWELVEAFLSKHSPGYVRDESPTAFNVATPECAILFDEDTGEPLSGRAYFNHDFGAGPILSAAFREFGFTVDWHGDDSRKVVVCLSEESVAEADEWSALVQAFEES
jgi:hypothetical protein